MGNESITKIYPYLWFTKVQLGIQSNWFQWLITQVNLKIYITENGLRGKHYPKGMCSRSLSFPSAVTPQCCQTDLQTSKLPNQSVYPPTILWDESTVAENREYTLLSLLVNKPIRLNLVLKRTFLLLIQFPDAQIPIGFLILYPPLSLIKYFSSASWVGSPASNHKVPPNLVSKIKLGLSGDL